MASVVMGVFLFTWLYQHTRGSLLIATAFHASMNTWTTVLPVPSGSPVFMWLLAAAQLVVVGIVLLTSGMRWLTHRAAKDSTDQS
jgi:hypothetical protein